MNKQDLLDVMNTKDIRCIGNSEDVIFVNNIEEYRGKDNKNYCDGINVLINSEDGLEDDISQLYCILNCGCHRNLEDYYSEKNMYDNPDEFISIAEKEIAPKPVEVTYYWYHHMMNDKDRKTIQKAIDEHDFETFIKYYKHYNSEGIKHGYIDNDEFNAFFPIVYLPNEASFIVDNEWHWINILHKDNFNRITFSESECG